MKILTKLPPGLSTWLLCAVVLFRAVLYFLTATIYGLFILSAALYGLVAWKTSVRPFSASELLLWVSDIPAEYQVAVFSSLLTVVGFLVAFHAATMNWKQQMRAQLIVNAAGEIEEFFAEASRLTVKARLYAESLLKTVDKITNQGDTDHAMFSVLYALEQTPQFLDTRSRLSLLSVEVHRILGKNSSLLSTIPGVISRLEKANQAFMQVTQEMWIHFPYIRPDDHDILNQFLRQVDIEKCRAFIACCNDNYGYMNGITGWVRGQLLEPIVGFNLSSILLMFSVRRQIRQFVETLQRNHKNGR